MELGQRLRQARLEAGLSQRQLCGDTITRNMLSQIENGSARPSMDSLRYLAAQLGKPMGYFLEAQAVTSPNQTIMAQARQAAPGQVLQLLKDYHAPDPVFDHERYLLEAMACLILAEQALAAGKNTLAATMLSQASRAGALTPYYTPETERRRLLLLGQTGTETAAVVAALLPDNTQELLLRATAALENRDLPKAQRLLDAAEDHSGQYHLLQAEICFAAGQYARAAAHYEQTTPTPQIYARLEVCFRELGNFERAYHYACLQR